MVKRAVRELYFKKLRLVRARKIVLTIGGQLVTFPELY